MQNVDAAVGIPQDLSHEGYRDIQGLKALLQELSFWDFVARDLSRGGYCELQGLKPLLQVLSFWDFVARDLTREG